MTISVLTSRIWTHLMQRVRDIRGAVMDSKEQNVDLINEAIKKLLNEERKNSEASAGDTLVQADDDKDEDRRLLSRLLSQVESLKENGGLQQSEDPSKLGEGEVASSVDGGSQQQKMEGDGKAEGGDRGGEIDKEELMKELNKVKKQNTITHWLLSIMIVLTVAWQASEMTMLMKVRDRISHPFKYFRGFIKGKDSDKQQHQSDPPPLPPLTMPELPQVEMPNLHLTPDKQ